MSELEGSYSKNVEFVRYDLGDPAVAKEADFWVKQFKVDSIPVVAFISPKGENVYTELVGKFPLDALEANTKALSEGQKLPFAMSDVFGSGKVALPS